MILRSIKINSCDFRTWRKSSHVFKCVIHNRIFLWQFLLACKILCKQVSHKCVNSCAQFVNQNGLNSQLAIRLGGSQRSNLNSKYLGGKYPDSFIWVYCVQQRYEARLTLLEHLVAWELNVQWEHLFRTILKWLRRKNTDLRGLRTTQRETAKQAILLDNILVFTLWRLTRKTEIQLNPG